MVYVFLAEGFEEIEALTPVDILRRAGVEVTTVGVGGESVTGAHGITVRADASDKTACKKSCSGEKTFSDIEALILPGGMPGTKNLDTSDAVELALKAATEKNVLIAAICAAPSVLGKRGLLKGKKATCYPGFEKELHEAEFCDLPVTEDGKIICGRAMGSAVQFALAIVKALKGNDAAEKIRAGILA